MKTPKEILLHQHRRIVPALDQVRRNVLSTLGWPARQSAVNPSGAGWITQRLWIELIVSCRRVWSGLAAAWLVIAVLAWSGANPAAPTQPALPSSVSAVSQRLKQQHHLLSDVDEQIQEEPSSPVPRGRSDVHLPMKSV